MRRFKAKELLWLAVLCAIPAVVLALPWFKATAFAPFEPVIDEVHFARTGNNTNDPEVRGYIVTIYISHTGPRPQWWGKKEGVARTRDYPNGSYIYSPGLHMRELVNPRFVDSKGKTYRWHSMGVGFNLYDDVSQRYLMHCDTSVHRDFKVENSRFVAGVKMASGTAKVDTIVTLSPRL
jgi:hypothetical protein